MNKNNQLRVSYAKAVHDEKEEEKVLRVLREHRTIMGQEVEEFEKRVAKYFGKSYGIMVNSGSSANMLAADLINAPEGSEIITPLLTFSTTVAPFVQKRLVPVFIDVEPGKYTLNISQIEEAIAKKTKAIMAPLLLGNVPDIEKLSAIAKKHKLFLIEDSCDTFAPTFNGKPIGTFTDITTTSFYGSHIITAGGGGGMIMVNKKNLCNRAKMLRGWGRRSSIFEESESIEKRFSVLLDNIAYDAKFIFDEIGYNFLPLELGAAFGNAQLDKLASFKKIRRRNFDRLYKFFSKYEKLFILPKQDIRVDTQWLAFPLTIKPKAPFNRLQIMTFLEKNNIQTRPIFTGNILRQIGFKNIKHKIIKDGCPVTDEIMKNGFLVGCHQGLSQEHISKIKETVAAFVKKYIR